MNTTPHNTPSTGGIHRGVWIGGGLMALTIVALATTLVVKNNSAPIDPAATTTASGTAAPLVAANLTPGATSDQSSVANQPAGTTPAPIGTPATAPVNESTRPSHYAPPAHHEGARDNAPQQVAAAAPACASCGVVEGYSAVKIQGQNNGVGAVAGGLGGALVGSKIGGRGNHTVGGLVGAIGGGLLGNAIESHERTVTEYDVRVRMEDGSTRTVRQATVPNVGQRVNVEGHVLHPLDAQG